VVCPAVDDHHGLVQARGQGRRAAVRESEKDGVVTGEGLRRGLQKHAVGKRCQVRVVLAQRGACAVPCRQRSDLDGRVPTEQAEELTSDVPAGTGDRNPHHE
jgi:hypothetical protein